MSWPWATRPQGRGAFSSGGGGPSRQHGNGGSTNGTGMGTSISKTQTPSAAQSMSRKTQAASTSSGKRKKKKRPVQGEDRFEGQLAYSVSGEKAPFKPFATTLRQLRAGVPPKNALAPLITPRSRYTRSYFVQYGGREMYSSVVERLSFRFKAGVHDEGYYCRFCENRIPGDKTFRVLDYAAHFTSGGCPALTGPDLETFTAALRDVDPTTAQQVEDERSARELQKQEQGIGKRGRGNQTRHDDDDSEYETGSDSDSSDDPEVSDDSEEGAPAASTPAFVSQGWHVPQALLVVPSNYASSSAPTKDPLAGQLARIAVHANRFGAPMTYEDQPVKLLSETLRELRGGVHPDSALTARFSPAASRLRGYLIDLDDVQSDHENCLNSCNRQPHPFGYYCRLCFASISISTSVPYRQMWRHFKGGSCKALTGVDLELFLLAIQEVDKRFCARLEDAGVLAKGNAKKGKPHRKRVRVAGGTLAEEPNLSKNGSSSIYTYNSAVLAGASHPVSTPLKMPGCPEVPSTHQASADLTYGDEDDDDDDDEANSDDDFGSLQASLGLNDLHPTTSGAGTGTAEKPGVAASHPSPFRIKEQSPDSNALFTNLKYAPEGQATKLALEPSPKALWPATRASASSLPASVLPYATILEASGISTNEDFEGLRGMILSQADLDGFLASVYSDHEKSLSLTTIKKFGLRQSLIKALGLA